MTVQDLKIILKFSENCLESVQEFSKIKNHYANMIIGPGKSANPGGLVPVGDGSPRRKQYQTFEVWPQWAQGQGLPSTVGPSPAPTVRSGNGSSAGNLINSNNNVAVGSADGAYLSQVEHKLAQLGALLEEETHRRVTAERDLAQARRELDMTGKSLFQVRQANDQLRVLLDKKDFHGAQSLAETIPLSTGQLPPTFGGGVPGGASSHMPPHVQIPHFNIPSFSNLQDGLGAQEAKTVLDGMSKKSYNTFMIFPRKVSKFILT